MTAKRKKRGDSFLGIALISCALFGGCATAPGGPAEAPAQLAVAADPNAPISWHLTANRLGFALRGLGETAGGGAVLMNGLEEYPLAPQAKTELSARAILDILAREADCRVDRADGYAFIYPTDYEILTGLRLDEALAGKFDKEVLPFSLGAGTSLYDAFALLGYYNGITIIADNAVAEAESGELYLRGVSLQSAVEAILKSARIVPGSFAAIGTEDHVYIHSLENPARRSVLLNGDSLNAEDAARLEQKVSLHLPKAPDDARHFEAGGGAMSLRDALPAISQQLGLSVRAEERLHDFPINPAVMNDVPLRTALDLLIMPWLIPQFGYEMEGGAATIRYAPEP
ncbi:MAG: hypothetical protein QGG73_06555 [Candidatus Hydrogenedentes bacterium]|nr:hypothetical protein [Candidatus Hydrogenedentota bacterium]